MTPDLPIPSVPGHDLPVAIGVSIGVMLLIVVVGLVKGGILKLKSSPQDQAPTGRRPFSESMAPASGFVTESALWQEHLVRWKAQHDELCGLKLGKIEGELETIARRLDDVHSLLETFIKRVFEGELSPDKKPPRR